MTPLSPKSLFFNSATLLQGAARTMGGCPVVGHWEPISTLVLVAAKVLGGLLCILRREANLTMVESTGWELEAGCLPSTSC